MGRPAISPEGTRILTVRVAPELAEDLAAEAERTGRTVATVMRERLTPKRRRETR